MSKVHDIESTAYRAFLDAGADLDKLRPFGFLKGDEEKNAAKQRLVELDGVADRCFVSRVKAKALRRAMGE